MSTQPKFIAYSVIEKGKNKKAYWHRVGAAWSHDSGDGLSIQLDSLPTDGKIVLLPPKADADTAQGEG